ncbi:hypothetical protein F4678DRAFT_243046 [Xylaria arbuscula]|nr:hypothetical protein F4678DRAFT_243046 [Xylaria arbuscula]
MLYHFVCVGVAPLGHLYVAPGFTLDEIYQNRNGSLKVISIEEGVLDTWWWKRIVLVGDSVRKLKPHEGLGYNSGLSDCGHCQQAPAIDAGEDGIASGYGGPGGCVSRVPDAVHEGYANHHRCVREESAEVCMAGDE